MPLLTRRAFLRGAVASAASAFAGAAYAFGYGPLQAPRVARYHVAPRVWCRRGSC